MSHAGAKSGTSAGVLIGGGVLGGANKYTPGIGGSENGDENGTKVYELMGVPDGSDWVRALESLVDEVWELERGEYEVPLLDDGELARLEVEREYGYGGWDVDGEEDANVKESPGGDGKCEE